MKKLWVQDQFQVVSQTESSSDTTDLVSDTEVVNSVDDGVESDLVDSVSGTAGPGQEALGMQSSFPRVFECFRQRETGQKGESCVVELSQNETKFCCSDQHFVDLWRRFVIWLD